MKLYTEEQVRFIATRFRHKCSLKGAVTNKDTVDYFDELISSNYFDITPIELPSDEYIDEVFQPMTELHQYYKDGFINGAKWMKEQILNQNK